MVSFRKRTHHRRDGLRVVERVLFSDKQCHVGGCNREGKVLISHPWVQWHPKRDANGLLFYETIEGSTEWWHCDFHARKKGFRSGS